MFSIAFIGTCLSWVMQSRFGRRTIYLVGLVAMLPIMWTVGFLDLASPSATIRWTQSSLLLIWFFCYGKPLNTANLPCQHPDAMSSTGLTVTSGITIGPTPSAIASEVGASNLRMKTIALGRNMYYFLSIVNVIVAPYMLNPA